MARERISGWLIYFTTFEKEGVVSWSKDPEKDRDGTAAYENREAIGSLVKSSFSALKMEANCILWRMNGWMNAEVR